MLNDMCFSSCCIYISIKYSWIVVWGSLFYVCTRLPSIHMDLDAAAVKVWYDILCVQAQFSNSKFCLSFLWIQRTQLRYAMPQGHIIFPGINKPAFIWSANLQKEYRTLVKFRWSEKERVWRNMKEYGWMDGEQERERETFRAMKEVGEREGARDGRWESMRESKEQASTEVTECESNH